ncbi:hypothetical protein [Cupriavidus sp. AcVe19-6a]|uniref:hypothetical protein n=1 Tax=Cupriavidus sp. AcVe19-6a TaxID=2821358 RepID=UPI001AE83AC9|nr:hypothetical protein [Cupriavidus sp. AcVe19-6a]MBP0634241.1 hypothetical protein [Cupriavidus sp. AcVe19-6a]
MKDTPPILGSFHPGADGKYSPALRDRSQVDKLIDDRRDELTNCLLAVLEDAAQGAALQHKVREIIDSHFEDIRADLRAGIERRSRRPTRKTGDLTPTERRHMKATFVAYCLDRLAAGQAVNRAAAYRHVAKSMEIAQSTVKKCLLDVATPDEKLLRDVRG